MGKIYDQLSVEERTIIQTQLAMGMKPSAIARWLERSPSTVSRELRRNGWVSPKAPRRPGRGAVAELVGIGCGVVSGVFNLESSGIEAPDWRPRHDEHYHEA